LRTPDFAIRPVAEEDLDTVLHHLRYDGVNDIESLALFGHDERRARHYVQLMQLMQLMQLQQQWAIAVLLADDKLVGFLDHSRPGGNRSKRLRVLHEIGGTLRFLKALPVLYSRWRIDLHTPNEAFCINNIRVDPAHRSNGYGSALLQWAEERARDARYPRMALQTLSNSPAIRLYERHGFRIVTSRSNRVYRHYVGAGRVLMEKPL
jgi:ribosomal protein S18 acetylase RimI-like enzyme